MAKNTKYDKIDKVEKGIKKTEKREYNQNFKINNEDKIYKFSVKKFIDDRIQDGVKKRDINRMVKNWANGYDGKIAVGDMIYDKNGIGIPAFEEWCVPVSNEEYTEYLRKINIIGTRE